MGGSAGCGWPSVFFSASGCERERIGKAMGAAVEKPERPAMHMSPARAYPRACAAGWCEFGARPGANGIGAYGPRPLPLPMVVRACACGDRPVLRASRTTRIPAHKGTSVSREALKYHVMYDRVCV